MYYKISPIVPGDMANDADVDTSLVPPVVRNASVIFKSSSLCDLMEIYPFYIVSDRLRDMIAKQSFSGVSWSKLTVKKDGLVVNGYSNMIITGGYDSDDFALGSNNLMIVNNRVLKEIKKFDIGECEISEYTHGLSPKEELALRMERRRAEMALKYPRK
jgi:hypothetical protein